MELLYNEHEKIKASKEWEEALKVLMREEIKMMKQLEYGLQPTWMICYVGDLADGRNLTFLSGIEESRPTDFTGDVRIIVNTREDNMK